MIKVNGKELTLSNSDLIMLGKARVLATFGQHRVRVGAVAAIKRTPIAGAFNTSRNLPSVEYPHCTVHAEVNLLKMIPYEKRSKVTIYVSRISRANKLLPSKPCNRCCNALGIAGIPEVVYYNGSTYISEAPFDARSK